MSATFYVYALIDSRTGSAFYIGKGKGARMDAHERDARIGCRSPRATRIREIWEAGGDVVKKKLAEFSDEDAAYKREAEEIAGRKGQLVNVGPGGYGGQRARRMAASNEDGITTAIHIRRDHWELLRRAAFARAEKTGERASVSAVIDELIESQKYQLGAT